MEKFAEPARADRTMVFATVHRDFFPRAIAQASDVCAYEKDFAPETPTAAAAITLFNPDKTREKAGMTSPPPEPR